MVSGFNSSRGLLPQASRRMAQPPSGSRKLGLGDLQRRLEAFRDDRDWRQFHTLKDLALAIGIEASELAEHFLWIRPEEESRRLAEQRAAIEAELADVFIHALNFASAARI